ncbi:carbohydrate ABC transporter permease [Butyrivibrio sp. MC2013]|uniref:carbohydrate ABC transporter permease n=1 Tax=Butyrivibrio sp. MC2013 TaxID=1280686 RepID=UPI000403F396|nr:carbohydrate ABC transporter permease [Butyrivibrio sp. MC2013]
MQKLDLTSTLIHLKTKLWGTPKDRGPVFKAIIYTLLISIGFVYLYPILDMFITSFMTLPDLLDASVKWIPRQLTLDNYKEAFEVMKVKETLWSTIEGALLPSLAQTLVCALTGYGLARYEFPFKKLIMALILLTFVVPPYVLMVPNYVMFSDYKLIGTLKTLIYPALLGQGTKSAIFILIFMQFFKQTPLALDEAARVDGASDAGIFLKIAVPLAIPAFILCFVFSFVWYWNDTYFTALYLNGANIADTSKISTMLLELQNFDAMYKAHIQNSAGWGASVMGESVANEAIRMASTVLTILPLLIMYFALQKYFVEGIDRAGITGE